MHVKCKENRNYFSLWKTANLTFAKSNSFDTIKHTQTQFHSAEYDIKRNEERMIIMGRAP